MDGVGVEIVKTEETKGSGIKYLNINVSNSEVERNPDIVRLCADAGVLEYVKPKTGHWNSWFTEIKGNNIFNCMECGSTFIVEQGAYDMNYCPNCGAKMVEPHESEDKE